MSVLMKQVAAGKSCKRCNAFILFPAKPPGPTECGECKGLSSPDEVSHSFYVRCPMCKYVANAVVDCDYAYLYGDGKHGVTCPECNHGYAIVTHVSYEFTSPPLSEAAR